MTITLLTGDCRDMLPTLPSNSVHCVVTSPPYYGLRSYLDASHPDKHRELGSEATPEAYLAAMVGVFREIRRVMRHDATLWLNCGDAFTNKQLQMMPARLALALQADGFYLRSDIIWAKPNPMPESCTDRPTSAHEHVFLLTKAARYFYDADAVREEGEGYGRSARFRGDKYSNGASFDNSAELGVTQGGGRNSYDGSGRNLRNVWTIATHAFPEAHFATYPTALVERCIRAGTSERGCCAACGAPWIRQISVDYRKNRPSAGNDPRSRGEDKFSVGNGGAGWRGNGLLREVETTGWRASCQCNELRCISCSFVLDTTDARVSSTTKPMRPMREDVPRQEATDNLLQPGLLEGGSPDFAGSRVSVVQDDIPAEDSAHAPLFEALRSEMDGPEPLDDKGLDDNQQGIQTAAFTEPSQREGRWLRDGASSGDGEEAGQASDLQRGSAPQERGPARQSDCQLGANGKAPARRRTKAHVRSDVSALPEGISDERKCPHCGSRMEWTTPNVVPATVLDCFLGSGTTALVADRLQRHCIGIDLSLTYADMAQRRIEQDCPLFTSWAPAEDPEDARMADLFADAAE